MSDIKYTPRCAPDAQVLDEREVGGLACEGIGDCLYLFHPARRESWRRRQLLLQGGSIPAPATSLKWRVG